MDFYIWNIPKKIPLDKTQRVDKGAKCRQIRCEVPTDKTQRVDRKKYFYIFIIKFFIIKYLISSLFTWNFNKNPVVIQMKV